MRQAGTLSGSLDGFLGSTNDLAAISRTLAPLAASAGSTKTDIDHVNAIGDSRTYMAAVSPWFFTHYGVDTYNKNVSPPSPLYSTHFTNTLGFLQWMYLSDFHLYATKWENLLKSDVYPKIDLIEITTWNDFGESSYISPIKGDMPPTTRNWVDGMDHTGWLKLTKYYAQWFKTGSAPALTQDSIVMWARPQSVKATVGDPVGRPRDYQLVRLLSPPSSPSSPRSNHDFATAPRRPLGRRPRQIRRPRHPLHQRHRHRRRHPLLRRQTRLQQALPPPHHRLPHVRASGT